MKPHAAARMNPIRFAIRRRWITSAIGLSDKAQPSRRRSVATIMAPNKEIAVR